MDEPLEAITVNDPEIEGLWPSQLPEILTLPLNHPTPVLTNSALRWSGRVRAAPDRLQYYSLQIQDTT